ncbi:MAG: sigma-54-dependent Fis family transcriptional regulator [Bacteroidetes bacterium GWA2_30_7]|nr:MAG: sigma-54-dependent Fis family transcriptional regulator [Bacteroidetes bacterium GWA2_30_7]
MASLKILIVDDERIIRVTLADDLKDNGYSVFEFSEPRTALLHIRDNDVDVVITDLKMPNMDGISFLKEIKKIKEEIFVVIMTAFASYPTAVEAIKLGAYDFVTKPFDSEKILLIIERIKEVKLLKTENKSLRTQIQQIYDFSSFVGNSPEIKEVFNLVELVANSTSTVLIVGETGTGKELLTNIIHYNSNRKKESFVKVSCAILSKEIFESELFGHEKGAFTGAEKQKIGRFELANNGTLYLDDIDDIPIDLQVKFLRAIEQQEIERVGGSETIKINVRIIASTKVDLKELVKIGKFREDLFYRLNVFPINLPSLKERKSDIPLLINHFLQQLSPAKEIFVQPDVLTQLSNYEWKGNVRELKNITERLYLLSGSKNEINSSIIPQEILTNKINLENLNLENQSITDVLNDYEVSLIKNAINKFNGNKNKAAEYLGIPPSTLRSKLIKFNLE